MTPEQKLQALFAAQHPRQPDLSFDLVVMGRIARRRAVSRFVHLSMLIVVVAGVLAGAMLTLDAGQGQALSGLLAGIGAGALAALVVWNVRRAE